MSKAELSKIRSEVKERELAKMRWQWFKEYWKCRNVCDVCRKYGISRSIFYYWKKRIDVGSSSGTYKTSKKRRLMSYSRKPKTNPKMYSDETVKLILKIRKRTKMGAEHIWFILRDKYEICVSVTGVYKVLKRNGLIQTRKHKRKENRTYEAPKYLPGDKVQIDLKYVRLEDEVAKRQGKKFRWVYQHTAIDVATGIKFKMIYEERDTQASVDFLSRVKLFYPFPIKVIQTDNGFEFTWRLHPEITKTHPFTLQCQLYGYEHRLIPPAYPRANSHVERTHRIDAEEVYRARTFTSLCYDCSN